MNEITKKSLYKLGVLAFLGVANIAIAQDYTGKVGINTESPKATLDITAKVADGSQAEGLKTPQMTGDALKAMTAQLTADNDGLVVFVSSAVTTPDASTLAVTLPGHYRFNFTAQNPISVSQGKSFYAAKSWVRLEPTGLEIVEEGGKIGRRLVGVNPDRYGNIGTAAIDMSFQNNGTTDGGATGNYSLAVGVATKATGDNSFAGGQENTTLGKNSVAIVGYQNTASGINSFVGGEKSSTSGQNSFAFGNNVSASGLNSFAFGHTAKVSSESAIAFGRNVEVKGAESLSSFTVGQNNIIDNSPNSFVFGANSLIEPTDKANVATKSQNSFAGGAGSSVRGNSTMAMGNKVNAFGNGSFVAGSEAYANGNGSIALGSGAKVGEMAVTYTSNRPTEVSRTRAAHQSIAIGSNANVQAGNSVALGDGATVGVGHGASVAIGQGATTTKGSQIVIGSSSTTVVLGKLENEAGITEGDTCTEAGKIAYSAGSFYGCAGGTWKKLHN